MTAATLVVIPMRNEAATIEAVVAGVRRHAVDVLVVDDGSTDAGAERARAAGADVLSLSPNRGKGFALRQGLRVAAERGYARVATLDADLEHDPADLAALLAALDDGADVVLGERRLGWAIGCGRWLFQGQAADELASYDERHAHPVGAWLWAQSS